ncbi:MAG: biotin synthase [Firmicutes bacterium HGW-Firmicutes-14]|nr:MAG: biotin synthase [Firmicutes bacterium HGW-Firmicutes-14]
MKFYLDLFSGETLPGKFNLAINWIKANTVKGKGIKITSQRPNNELYPEVTGYFIPSLLNWGERDLALQNGRWLLSIQNPDGSWSDPTGETSYTFDTGQILKGLLALAEDHPEFQEPIIHGCDWILAQIEENGRVTTPDASSWVLPNNRVVPEAIHLYSLQPLKEAGVRWGNNKYCEAVEKALAYYLKMEELTEFNTLSHFHAYIIEALIDLGCTELAEASMEIIAKYQNKRGAVPAYPDVKWVCSTGLFQYALIWYKLGNTDRADRAFKYACRLQNKTGGFYGSYGFGANYFPKEEISWAVKYFLDSFFWKVKSSFNNEVASFSESIDETDGRYQLIAKIVDREGLKKILDIGCGKGRYITKLKSRKPQIEAYGVDISEQMLKNLPEDIMGIQGSLLNMPFKDKSFDLGYCVEALEHAVNVPGAIREMCRLIKDAGTLIIIDKNKEKHGKLKLSDWEQWYSEGQILELLRNEGFKVEVYRNVPYDNKDGTDGLFLAWVAKKAGL